MSYIDELISVCEKYQCRYKLDEPLKNHTTFKIGGACKIAVFLNCEGCAVDIINYCRNNKIKFAVIGNGSNVIAEDKGFDGAVLILGNDFSNINFIRDEVVECEAGLLLSRLCAVMMHQGLSGLEFAYGIPGTVGGALYMNAGAYGGEIADIVTSADYIDSDGMVKTIMKENMDLSYRHSAFMNSGRIIIRIRLKLHKGEIPEIEQKMEQLITRRREKQPLNFPSAGSTFKRPDGAYASALIEQCGLKGLSVGDAQVSEKHSGFVINKGNATCEDIINLVNKVKEKVRSDTGYELELEPEILK